MKLFVLMYLIYHQDIDIAPGTTNSMEVGGKVLIPFRLVLQMVSDQINHGDLQASHIKIIVWKLVLTLNMVFMLSSDYNNKDEKNKEVRCILNFFF